ncbi:Two-component sensor histidine kinase, contains HisKA and HATPase domains [Dyadobacter soli]|uniref:histidine kinase n=1 Tax=Dyadobacter soli TaxID=659014 RepID=A0A1G8CNU7_9BACT|nr:histidine kinase dimerization/phosphoacceptor domain -containing protein [Dyadobacter soli]SDH47178.1 Two-component sensor histidine kinase, contains HisKA and HATPase domains [Dyadobacter soli]
MVKILTPIVALLFLAFSSYADYLGPFTPKDTAPILAKLKSSRADTSRVILYVQLSDQYYYREGRNAKELDSARLYSKAAEKLAATLHFNKGLALAYFQQAAILKLFDLPENAKQANQKAISIFIKQKNYAMLGESYYRQGGFYSLSDSEIEGRINYFKKSLDAFRSGRFTLKAGDVLMAIGELYMIHGDDQSALTYLKQSLHTYQSIGYRKLMAVYDLLGIVYKILGMPDEGIKYGIMCLRTARSLNDTSLPIATYYNRVGLLQFSLGEYKNASKNFVEGLEIAKKFKDTTTVHIIAANQASSLVRLQKYQDALRFLDSISIGFPLKELRQRYWINRAYVQLYCEIKQYNKATKYANELLKIVENSVEQSAVKERIYLTLIQYYLAKADYESAKKLVKIHKILAINSNSKELTYMNDFWQSTLDSANHNYLSALAHYQKYSALKDSVFNENKTKLISKLEVVYETEIKEEKISQLKKESALQQKMLHQASLINIIMFVGIALLLVITGLLIYGYKLVKKNNKDISLRQEEINKKNALLERLLTEKEWLMKEIHHRVKNNLHMIVGLLESQSEFLKGDEAKMALSESEHRIHSMSLIHQKLYQSDNLSSIDISPYIHELVEYLRDSFQTNSQVTFNLDIQQLEMNISHSIPLGLILNEAIINSLKYAFPDGRPGNIDVVFKQKSTQNFLLIISDNGIGMAQDFEQHNISSFGLTLIKGLSEELGGNLVIENKGGTTIQVDFKYITEEKDTAQHASLSSTLY